METLGTRLRFLRGNASQGEFAERLSVHKNQLGKYERDETNPGSEFLITLQEKTGVNLHWLLTGEGNPNPSTSINAGETSEAAGYPPPHASAVNSSLLQDILLFVDKWLRDSRRTMTIEKKAHVVAEIYAIVQEDDQEKEQTFNGERIGRILRLVS